MKTILATAAAAMLFTAGGAWAADDDDFLITTGDDLASLCSTAPNDENYVAAIHMCEGYIVGVHQLHTAMTEAPDSAKIYCLPATNPPTRDEAAASFSAWLGNTPQAADLPAVEALARWAAALYPCK